MEQENEFLDLGVSNGVHKTLSFEGDQAIVKSTFDAEQHLRHAEHARQSTDGQRWGDGKFIGHIPPVFYAQIVKIKDPDEREKAVMKFFRENPAFVMFERFKRDL